jgi:hypothetical protein
MVGEVHCLLGHHKQVHIQGIVGAQLPSQALFDLLEVALIHLPITTQQQNICP